ncbi:hypothetical protein EBN03_10810 [Nocardia stercoris]|uniref:Uncharacterized protein n=2 Tax=Nocardia stercoris TaxID=2483361 RepID=A0A3M2LC86_9NOCA|nr:hypothetical protein EBN03_10810 [Nocardia stercoris]
MIDISDSEGIWDIGVSGPDDAAAGQTTVSPTINGNTVTARLPLHVAISGNLAGSSTVDLSSFTHIGWASSALVDGASWMDGCPTDGESAGNPGAWEIPMS